MCIRDREECCLVVEGRRYRAVLETRTHPRRVAPRPPGEDAAEVTAPLPGLLVEVRVTEGQRVGKGETVAVLESMKMHLELRAPLDGVVETVRCDPGAEVAQGQPLVRIRAVQGTVL